MNRFDVPKFQLAEVLRTSKASFCATRAIPDRLLQRMASQQELVSEYDFHTRCLLISMVSYMESIEDERVSVHERWPADWFQAFKERWFPRWLLARFPVRYSGVDVDRQIYRAVCPHLHGGDSSPHAEWLLLAGHGRTFVDVELLRDAEHLIREILSDLGFKCVQRLKGESSDTGTYASRVADRLREVIEDADRRLSGDERERQE